MNKIVRFIFLAIVTFVFSTQFAFAHDGDHGRIFTVQELSAFTGKNGAKAYTAYEGHVYDVTESKLWALGEHFGLQAGIDLTEKMKDAPHGPEVFSGFTIVGTLENGAESGTQNGVSAEGTTEKSAGSVQASQEEAQPVVQAPWYAKRIQPLGISILGWTGIVLGIFFVFTFATCFALPWAKLPLPWKGSKIGADPLDNSGTHMVWSSIHKYFVWITVIFGIVHGILGFMQMLGIYL